MSSSADLLRRAAVQLREHAQALELPPMTSATPWTLEADEEIDNTSVVAEVLNVTTVIAMDVFSDECGSYIALMHPPVALALADWLEAVAPTAGIDAYPPYSIAGTPLQKAIDVARAVLREPEEKPDA